MVAPALPLGRDPLAEIAGSILAMATAVVVKGREIITGRMRGGTPSQAEPLHIGVGTGTTATTTGDTALATERTVEARVAGTSSQQTTTSTNDTYQVTGTWTKSDAGTVAITEVGLFDATRGAGVAAPVGNMFLRGDFAAVNCAQNDSIAFTVKAQITSSAA